MSHFSIGSWSFHGLFHSEKMSLFGYLESIKYRYRLRHADIWNGMLLSTEAAYIQSIRHTLREEGLTVANLAVDGADVWHDDPDVRERNHQKALLYLDIARQWGVQTLRIDLGGKTVDMTEEQVEFCIKRYREYAQVAADYGFRVGPQTHQAPAQSPGNLKRLAEEISAPGFGVVLNVNRWLTDKAVGDEIVAPFTIHVQFDRAFVDFKGSELLEKVKLFQNCGYQGCWSMEFRGGADEYLEIERDLLDIRQAVGLAG